MYNEEADRYELYVGQELAAWMELDVQDGYLHGLFTFPKFRRQGLCKQLVQYAMEECDELALFTNSPIVLDMCLKLGFTEEDSVMASFRKLRR